MAKVFLKDGESVDSAIKRFKNKVFKDGTLNETKKREYYTKTAEARKMKQKQARIKNKAFKKPYNGEK